MKKIVQFSAETDAVRPFLVRKPEEIYEKSNIDKAAMFGVTSQVRIPSIFKFWSDLFVEFQHLSTTLLILRFQLISFHLKCPLGIFFLAIVRWIQEFMGLRKTSSEYRKTFNVLPFRDLNFSMDSRVSRTFRFSSVTECDHSSF